MHACSMCETVQGALSHARRWLLVLYTLVHWLLNIAAELTCFGDREFGLKLATLTVYRASQLSESV